MMGRESLEIPPLIAQQQIQQSIEIVVRVESHLDDPFVSVTESQAHISLQVRPELIFNLPNRWINSSARRLCRAALLQPSAVDGSRFPGRSIQFANSLLESANAHPARCGFFGELYGRMLRR